MAKKDELNFENENKIAPSEKLKALQAAMDKIEKSFGKGSIMKMGDESVEQVEVIPTGSIGLNVALGVGGYPRGRIIEIYGPESSGKTTLAIHAIAEAQKAGGIAAFIDAEHAFDRFYAAKLGVDVDNLLISQPDNGVLLHRHGALPDVFSVLSCARSSSARCSEPRYPARRSLLLTLFSCCLRPFPLLRDVHP